MNPWNFEITNLPTTRKKQPSKDWVTYPCEKLESCRASLRFFEIEELRRFACVREAAWGVRRVGQGGLLEELEGALLDTRRPLVLL